MLVDRAEHALPRLQPSESGPGFKPPMAARCGRGYLAPPKRHLQEPAFFMACHNELKPGENRSPRRQCQRPLFFRTPHRRCARPRPRRLHDVGDGTEVLSVSEWLDRIEAAVHEGYLMAMEGRQARSRQTD
jgi:hypothetical protein